MKQVITATSFNSTVFYYNSDKGRFDQHDMVDIWGTDHYECDEHTMDFAKEVAEKNGLKNVKLETISNEE